LRAEIPCLSPARIDLDQSLINPGYKINDIMLMFNQAKAGQNATFFLMLLLKCLHGFTRSLTGTLLSVFLLCSLGSGCGYHFREVGTPTGITLDSIAIPLFSSTSTYLGYEGEFTRILRGEFITHSRVKIMRKGQAQAVLSGSIYSITTEPLTYTVQSQTIHGYSSTDEVTSSRTMTVRVSATLTESATGTIIWQDSNLTGEASFSVSADPLVNRYNQRQAFVSIAQDVATLIYSQTMERF
jgi:outer membrane lipopolysaccharide assembly protein LptE/RlpB